MNIYKFRGYLPNPGAFFLSVFILALLSYISFRNHSCTEFDYIESKYIPNDLVMIKIAQPTTKGALDPCRFPTYTQVPIKDVFAEDIEFPNLVIERGFAPNSQWQPKSCKPIVDSAIIVPYRKRPTQLQVFLHHMHHFLQMQQISYTLFIVEQTDEKPFNRAKLFNVGFTEAMKLRNFTCFIFHDVDLLPENLLNIYGCSHSPRHMPTAINTFRYNLPYCDLFGGATAMTTEQFKDVNGFANRFFGWGGEDDDMAVRILYNGYRIIRWDPSIARYTMLYHTKEAPNSDRFNLLNDVEILQKSDGLNTLKYKRLEFEERNLYTWILVDV